MDFFFGAGAATWPVSGIRFPICMTSAFSVFSRRQPIPSKATSRRVPAHGLCRREWNHLLKQFPAVITGNGLRRYRPLYPDKSGGNHASSGNSSVPALQKRRCCFRVPRPFPNPGIFLLRARRLPVCVPNRRWLRNIFRARYGSPSPCPHWESLEELQGGLHPARAEENIPVGENYVFSLCRAEHEIPGSNFADIGIGKDQILDLALLAGLFQVAAHFAAGTVIETITSYGWASTRVAFRLSITILSTSRLCS